MNIALKQLSVYDLEFKTIPSELLFVFFEQHIAWQIWFLNGMFSLCNDIPGFFSERLDVYLLFGNLINHTLQETTNRL